MNAIVPVDQTETTVTLTRTDYEALIGRLEDAVDYEIMRRSEADRARLSEEEYQRLRYTDVETRRIVLEDVSSLTIWRERARQSQRALAAAANVSASYLAEVETGKKPGSAAFFVSVAKALNIPMELLVPETEN